MNAPITKCPICSGKRTSRLKKHPDFSEASIYYCDNCNHGFTFPEPDAFWLEKYYEDVYPLKRSNFFGDRYFQTMKLRAKAQMEFIARALKPTIASDDFKHFKILDWGCGIGALVAAFESKGTWVVGYDSDLAAIHMGKTLWGCNISTMPSNIEELHSGFEILCMSHVIEHLADIRKTLEHILKMLKPGGYFFMEVPNCHRGMFRINQDTESHLHFFTQMSLQHLMAILDLKAVRCVSCGPPKSTRSGLQQIAGKIFRHTVIESLPCSWLEIPRRIGKTFRKTSGTDYDGYYDKYYNATDSRGMWLRCLARKPN